MKSYPFPVSHFLTSVLLGLLPLAIQAEEVSRSKIPSIWEQDTLTGDWAGTRTDWKNHGLQIEGNLIAETLSNLSGGNRRQTLYQHRADLALTFDWSRTTGWKGATTRAGLLWLQGTESNNRNDMPGMTGSLSDPSNISAYDTVRLYEFWHEQSWFDGKLSLRAGQMLADTTCITCDTGSPLINGTFGWPAFKSTSLPNSGPAYPVGGLGVMMTVAPHSQLTYRGSLKEMWALKTLIIDMASSGVWQKMRVSSPYMNWFGTLMKIPPPPISSVITSWEAGIIRIVLMTNGSTAQALHWLMTAACRDARRMEPPNLTKEIMVSIW